MLNILLWLLKSISELAFRFLAELAFKANFSFFKKHSFEKCLCKPTSDLQFGTELYITNDASIIVN